MKPKTKSFFDMTEDEKEGFVRKLERGIPARQLKQLSAEDKALWRAAKRGLGGPRKSSGRKAVPVRVNLEPKLLKAIDAFAASNGLSRAELLTRGAKLAMGK
jgi:hypothetical protein